MALQVLHPGVTVMGKRKHSGDGDDAITTKRLREGADSTITSTPTQSLSSQPLQSLLVELKPKYDVKTLSVLSSTSIAKRVDAVLQHLGRISAWDQTVLPGIVLLFARSNSTNKLITIVETVRRRIHESEQKWYQYNRLYEMELAAKQHSNNHNRNEQQSQKVESMVEDTVMSIDIGNDSDDDDDDDDFEIMKPRQQTLFERAVHGEEKAKPTAHMSIILSRIPIPELKAKESFAVQSNEEYINYLRRKKAGLA